MTDPVVSADKYLIDNYVHHPTGDPLYFPTWRCSECRQPLHDDAIILHRGGKPISLRFCDLECMMLHVNKSGMPFIGKATDAIFDYIAQWRREEEEYWYEHEFIPTLREAQL